MADIMFFNRTNPFKALKRFFALVKLRKDAKAAAILVPIMNSDLGRLYQIIGDLQTLRGLMDRPSSAYNLKEILSQIDDMKARKGKLDKLISELEGINNEGALKIINSTLKNVFPTGK